ncbi:sigma-54-dependent transcriptional regulator [Candidatus Margulisiibacteriota bacterium]
MAENKATILVVDDELSIRESFSLILGKDFHVLLAASGEAALKKLIDEKVDLIYLDVRMPGMNGMETLKKLKEIDNDTSVVMVTAVNDVQNASEAIKSGAANYLIKPFDSNEILKMTRSFTQKKTTYEEAKTIRSKQTGSETPGLAGNSKAVQELEAAIERTAEKATPALIYGENGTEKELIARLIHNGSQRASAPFMTYYLPKDCSEETVRKQLFGQEKGAFVAEFRKEEGVLERSASGTLLLCNIEFLSKNLQLELKNILAHKAFSRVGSMSTIPLGARLICASSQDLRKLAEKRSFLKELLDQISMDILKIPKLKDRSGDIAASIRFFLEKHAKAFNREVKLSKKALDIMLGYPWPGNITEAENTIKLLVLNSKEDQEIMPEDLPFDILLGSSSDTLDHVNFEEIKKRFEKDHISKILKKVDQDRSKAADLLGISPKIFESKLESLQD